MLNFQNIYEIQLQGRRITVDFDVWSQICDYVNSSTWFYVIHKGMAYKYIHTQTFYDRPARYDFELIKPWDEEPIKYIYL